jgi:chaperonin GroES
MKQLKAQFNAIIVKPIDKEEQSYGNIIVPDVGKERSLTGTIVSVGPGKYTISGNLVPCSLKEGQKVIVPPMGPTKAEYDGQEYYICSENVVLAIIED